MSVKALFKNVIYLKFNYKISIFISNIIIAKVLNYIALAALLSIFPPQTFAYGLMNVLINIHYYVI
jgi:hypothetical protein